MRPVAFALVAAAACSVCACAPAKHPVVIEQTSIRALAYPKTAFGPILLQAWNTPRDCAILRVQPDGRQLDEYLGAHVVTAIGKITYTEPSDTRHGDVSLKEIADDGPAARDSTVPWCAWGRFTVEARPDGPFLAGEGGGHVVGAQESGVAALAGRGVEVVGVLHPDGNFDVMAFTAAH